MKQNLLSQHFLEFCNHPVPFLPFKPKFCHQQFPETFWKHPEKFEVSSEVWNIKRCGKRYQKITMSKLEWSSTEQRPFSVDWIEKSCVCKSINVSKRYFQQCKECVTIWYIIQRHPMAALSLEMHSNLHWKGELCGWHWQQCCDFVNTPCTRQVETIFWTHVASSIIIVSTPFIFFPLLNDQFNTFRSSSG